MDDRERKRPSVARAFAPVWLVVGLVLVAAVLLPVVVALLLDLAELTFRID